jgi:hypothetical protein
MRVWPYIWKVICALSIAIVRHLGGDTFDFGRLDPVVAANRRGCAERQVDWGGLDGHCNRPDSVWQITRVFETIIVRNKCVDCAQGAPRRRPKVVSW